MACYTNSLQEESVYKVIEGRRQKAEGRRQKAEVTNGCKTARPQDRKTVRLQDRKTVRLFDNKTKAR
jgi:hypothetical protein